MSDVTRILRSMEDGDPKAAAELLPLVYDELRRLAAAKMAKEHPGQTLQPTALVHEAWLRLSDNENRNSWKNRAHFIGVAAEAMRRVLVESARRKASLKRGGNPVRLNIEEAGIASAEPDEKILLLQDALTELETHDPDKARLVVLKFFGGLTNQEVAATLGVTERTVERQWSYAKSWLFHCIKAGAD